MKRVCKTLARNLLIVISCALLPTLALADNLLRADHPTHYVVKKGDTLWDIAARFLKSPWRWPDIWQVNQQIANPNLIYPGDELDLAYVNGKPELRLHRGIERVKLLPQVHSRPIRVAIPTIPIDAIAPFLSRPYVLNRGEAAKLPYIVSFGPDHLLGAAGLKAYVRSLPSAGGKYDVVRPGKPYKDPDTGDILGYAAAYVGTVTATHAGDPATVYFNSSQQEAMIGDRLIKVGGERPWTNFIPKPPAHPVHGAIIAVLNGVEEIGQYNVVVLDRGSEDGLVPGTVLEVDQRGETVRDPVSSGEVTLPAQKAGHLMVFRSFKRVSFALVMDATRAIHVLDLVRQP